MTQEFAKGATERVSTLNRLAGPLANAVAYRHPKRGKAHNIVIPLNPQPDPWDRSYTGLTACGFRLRWAFRAALAVTAPEARCRICWPEESR